VKNPFQQDAVAVDLPLHGIRTDAAAAAVSAAFVFHVRLPVTERVISDQIAGKHRAHPIELHLSGHAVCQ
jgi:hypothetical protein